MIKKGRKEGRKGGKKDRQEGNTSRRNNGR
jgi:hypothetical protein